MRFADEKSLFEQVSGAVLSHKLLILTVFTLVVGSGMIATFLITPKYEAGMSILISRDRVDLQINPSDKLPNNTQAAISDEEFNSELELLRSSQVISGVVRDLDLVNDQAPKNDSWLDNLRQRIKSKIYDSPWRVSAEENQESEKVTGGGGGGKSADEDFKLERTISRVQGNLDTVPVKKSRIIKVTYRDTDPVRAKNTLEKIYRKYVELHVRLNEKLQAGEVFGEQSDAFNRKLKSSTNSLKKFDVQNEISGAEIGVQRELLLKQLYDAQTQLNTTQAEIVETQQRIADLRIKVDAQPEQLQTSSVSKYVAAIDRLKEELVRLEQQRTQLAQKYQPTSRVVREIDGRIEQLKKSLAQEIASPPQEKSFALNDLKRKLTAELFSAETNLGALREREKKLAPLVAKLRDQSAVLNTKSIERANLEREKNINEEAYLLYEKKSRENDISRILNKEQVVNSSLIDPPRTDGVPKNPKPLLNLLILVGLGAAAAFASAVVLDKFSGADADVYDERLIVSAGEIERRWDLPVLASISDVQPPPRRRDGVRAIAKPVRRLLPPAASD